MTIIWEVEFESQLCSYETGQEATGSLFLTLEDAQASAKKTLKLLHPKSRISFFQDEEDPAEDWTIEMQINSRRTYPGSIRRRILNEKKKVISGLLKIETPLTYPAAVPTAQRKEISK